MEMAKTTYRIASHALVYCVYAIFFSVQFFFNFEGLSSSQQPFHYCAFLNVTPKEGGTIKGQPSKPFPGHKTRLNKRFHQENIPPCEVDSVVIPERYLPVQTPDYYLDIHLPSAVRVTHPLRGPPVVA